MDDEPSRHDEHAVSLLVFGETFDRHERLAIGARVGTGTRKVEAATDDLDGLASRLEHHFESFVSSFGAQALPPITFVG